MPELLQQSVNGNELLVFAVALFFSASSGQKMEPGQRVALVYLYCLIVSYFNYIGFCSIVFGSLIVLFLIFEVFSSDEMLVHLFSFKYKCLDFLYRLLLEFYGAFFYLILLFSATPLVKESVFAQIVFLIFVVALAAITSRRHFSTKPISRIIEELEALGGDPASCSFDGEDDRKLQILIYMEDENFLNRNEKTHIVTARYLASRVFLRQKRDRLALVGNSLSSFDALRRHIRGYGTIEMQIIRNVGLDFGSYRLTARRKLFELIFTQAVFNSYINHLSKNSQARKNIKKWILRCYLNLVSIKIDDIVRYPETGNSTFQQLFKRDFSELTEEEFFVWCLGLPHYEKGVGKCAIETHIDAVRHFGLCQESINETIIRLRTRCV
ncbi:transglycosylase domain-containing protein [Paraeggerthella hongkongensis]|uniref:transglycosylase domain-containing protein n=1 Tax=Paraeggerthella hominis TaxID=2897351 RepID=UPI001C1182E3|nr:MULTISPECIES: transglycosylase domain-containing protein [Paraeggerthella]MBU5406208.1 transglycosylase domain-containing protein [Paraeggerthella hongkongensis]MCD2434057.1 transglycosylase domain-containing protein [Paraeggerthella hominis]